MAQLAGGDRPEIPRDFSWRSELYAWSVVVLLTLAFTLSVMDRLILTLLVGPIKAEYHLSDVQVSLLHGLAFTLLYVFAGIPAGRLVDVRNRRTIAGASVFLWSLMTGACALAGNFVQLFLLRIGVGVGEAGLSPAANSLMSDYFSKEKLARPVAFFSIGATAGSGLAYLLGGQIVSRVSGMQSLHLPLIGDLHPWKVTFLIAAAPGLVLALLFRLVREPPRQGRTLAAGQQAGFNQVLSYMRANAGFIVPHFAAASLTALVLLSSQAWMPTRLIRHFGITAGEAGGRLGPVVMVASVSGLLVSGWMAERLAARGHQGASILVARGLALLGVVPAVLAPMMGTVPLTLVMVGLAGFGFGSALGLAPVALQIAVPNEIRGQVYAFYLMAMSLLGYAVGPFAVALVSDHLLHDERRVGDAMSMVAAVAAPAAALCFHLSLRAYRRLLPD